MFKRHPRTKKAVVAFLLVDTTVSAALLALGYSHRDALPVDRPSEAVVQEATPAPAPSELDSLLASGKCWLGGEGHPYPTTVFVNTPDGAVERGQRVVDRLLTDWDLDDVAAFCKR